MVHPYANPAGYMSASRDTLSSQGYGPKRGEDCRPPRRKRFSALSFMNMRNSKDLSSPGARPSPTSTVLSPTCTIVAPSPARSRAPSVSRSRAPSVSHSRAPSAPSAILSTPQPILSAPQPIAPTPPSIVRKPSSGSSRRGRDPPFIVKSSQHCTFEVALPAKTRVALPAKTRDGGVHSRTARSVPRATARHEQSRSRNEQSSTARSVPSRIARVPPPSITQAPSTTRPSPPSTARSSPPSTARSTTEYGSSTAIYSSPSTARSSPTLVSTPVLPSRVVNASTPNLAPHLSAAAQHSTGNIALAHSAGSLDPQSAGNAAASRSAGNAAYPDDTWSFFTPPTPAVPRFSFNWHGQPGRRGRMRLYGAQIKHYGVRFRHYGVRVKHSVRGARARQMKGKVITTYGKTKAKGKVLERQIAAGAKEASQFVKQVALAAKQEIREMRSSTAER